LLRELLYLKEFTGQQWPESMMQLLLGANRICTAARLQQRSLRAYEIAVFLTVYDALVREEETLHPEITQVADQHGRSKQSVAVNLLRRFKLHADASCASSATRLCRSQTTLAGALCACPRSNRKYPDASARSPARSTSALSALASTRYASKATAWSSSFNAPSPASLFRYLLSD
jgi:hypothetical protein